MGIFQYGYEVAIKTGLRTMEANVMPDSVLRPACRYLMSQRIKMSRRNNVELQQQDLMEFIEGTTFHLLHSLRAVH